MNQRKKLLSGIMSCFVLMFFAVKSLNAQTYSTPYYIEDDQVYFVFDVRDYAEAQREETMEKLDFSDLKIYNVALSGDFNDWSKNGWNMKKQDEYRYTLKKKIKDFNDVFEIDFKYVINEEYWAQPDVTFKKDHIFSNDFFENSFDVKVHGVQPKPDGNTIFFLSAHFSATNVILTGDFISWDEDDIMMNKVPDGWEIRIDLPPGRYEYKFIVDGEWTHDTQNPNFVYNEHQTLNSVLQKTSPISFKLTGYMDASQVLLAGSFNEWNQVPMLQTESGWQLDLPVQGGKHKYNFIIDGRWILDPSNPIREKDNHDIESSVLITR